MLRHLNKRPSPGKLAVLRATASGLAVDLEHELIRLDHGRRYEIPIERIYNSVYLPYAEALADGLAGIPDLDVLRAPMRADLARTQLRITLEMLYRLIAAMSASAT